MQEAPPPLARVGVWISFVLLAVVLPLAFSWTVAATFSTPKYLPLYVGAALGGFVAIALAARGAGTSADLADLCALVFLLWGVVCVTTATSRWTALVGTYNQGTGWLFWAAALSAWGSFRRFEISPRQRQQLLVVFLVGGVLVAAIALLSTLHWSPLRFRTGFRPDGRPSSTLGNPLFLGSYLALVIVCALDQVVTSLREDRDRAWELAGTVAATVALLLSVLALVLTLSRGAWLGAAAGVVVWGIDVARRARVEMRVLGGLAAVLIVVAVVAVFAVPRLSSARLVVGDRVGVSSVATATLDTRWQIWGIAVDAIADRPVVGWGPNNYRFAAQRHMTAERLAAEPTVRDADAHNLILELAATWGIPGAALLLGLWVLVMLGALRSRAPTASVALGVGAAFLISGLTMPQNVVVTAVALSLMGVAVPLAVSPSPATTSPVADRGTRGRLRGLLAFVRGPVALGVLAAAAVVALFWSVRYIRADEHYLRGTLTRDDSLAVAELGLATREFPVVEYYWTALGTAQAQAGKARGDADLHEEAFASYSRAIQISPRDYDTLRSLALLYLEQSNWVAARATAELAVEYAPMEPEGHAILAYASAKEGNRTRARSEALAATSIFETTDPRVWYLAGLAFSEAGETERAREMLQKALLLAPEYAPARDALAGLGTG
jgi:O-antigen ligase/Flp pilus assembly protein TadD